MFLNSQIDYTFTLHIRYTTVIPALFFLTLSVIHFYVFSSNSPQQYTLGSEKHCILYRSQYKAQWETGLPSQVVMSLSLQTETGLKQKDLLFKSQPALTSHSSLLCLHIYSQYTVVHSKADSKLAAWTCYAEVDTLITKCLGSGGRKNLYRKGQMKKRNGISQKIFLMKTAARGRDEMERHRTKFITFNSVNLNVPFIWGLLQQYF